MVWRQLKKDCQLHMNRKCDRGLMQRGQSTKRVFKIMLCVFDSLNVYKRCRFSGANKKKGERGLGIL